MRWLTVRTDFVTQISYPKMSKRQPEDSECSQPSRHVQRPYFTLIQWETNRRRKTASPFLSVHVAPIRNDNHPAVSRPSGARRKWFLSVVSVMTGAWPDSRHKKIFQHLISHGELLQFYFYFILFFTPVVSTVILVSTGGSVSTRQRDGIVKRLASSSEVDTGRCISMCVFGNR